MMLVPERKRWRFLVSAQPATIGSMVATVLASGLIAFDFVDASADTLEPAAIRGWPATGAAGGDFVVGHYSDRRCLLYPNQQHCCHDEN